MLIQRISILACLLFALQGFSQEVRVLPLGNNHYLNNFHNKNAFGFRGPVCPPQTLSLPFFDDFSDSGPYPDCNYWEDNQAFVNGTLGIEPPSVGVATLDGLRPDGTPWNINAQAGSSAPADTLTSQSINLSGVSTAYLFYMYQPQGLGDRPDLGDSLIVEIKNNSNQWVQVASYGGYSSPTNDSEVFFREIITITDAAMLHSGFQFRFRNLATNSGHNDLWHIDYVFVDDSPITIDPGTSQPVFSDLAFTELPKFALTEYTAMPIRQFLEETSLNINTDVLEFNIYNHTQNVLLPSFEIEMDELTTGTNLLSYNAFLPNNATPGRSTDTRSGGAALFSTNFDYSFLNNFTGDRAVIESRLKLSETNLVNSLFLRNDVVRRLTVLDNYYARDDGSAEGRMFVTGIGSKVAIEFQTAVADTVKGILIHLPYFVEALPSSAYLNFKVYLDSVSNVSEIHSEDFVFPVSLGYADNTDSLNAWWTYSFDIPVEIPAGRKFYVGWEMGTADFVFVGYDRNQPQAAEKTYINTGGSWERYSDLGGEGAVMFRPVMGGKPVNISRVNTLEVGALEVFPNPTSGMVYSKEEFNSFLTVYNNLGQVVHQGEFTSEVNLSNLTPGIYLLQFQSIESKEIKTAKVILY